MKLKFPNLEAVRKAVARVATPVATTPRVTAALPKQLGARDELSTGRGFKLRAQVATRLAGSGYTARPAGAAPATSLLTENAKDGSVNCLDRAVDAIALLPPAQQAKAELVALKDTRPGVEGATGHVVVRQNGAIVDPTTGQSWADTQSYLKANPQYVEQGTISAVDAQKIFATQPGSPERTAALDAAKVPAFLRTAKLADGGEFDVGALEDRLDELNETKDTITQLDQRLALEIDQFAGALTPDEQQAYIQAYREKNGYAELEATKAQQEAALLAEAQKPGFKQALEGGGFDTITAIGTLATLAESSQASGLVSLLGTLQGVQIPLDEGTSEDLLRGLAQKAAPNVYAEQLSASGGDPAKAAALTTQVYAPFANDPTIAPQLEALSEVANAPTSEAAVTAFEANLAIFNDDFGAAGYAAAGIKASLGAVNGTKGAVGLLSSDLQRLSALVQSGKVSDGIAVKVGTLLGKTLKVPGAQQLAQKVVPVLSSVFAGITAVGRLTDETKNLGTWVGLAGDLMSIGGGVLMASVVGAPVGFLLAGAGAILSVAGDVIDTLSDGELVQEEREAILKQMAEAGQLDPRLVDLYRTDPHQVKEMRDEWGMSTTQIAQLLETHPELSNIGSKSIKVFTALIEKYDVAPGDVQGLFDAMANDSTSYVAQAIQTRGPEGEVSNEDLKTYLGLMPATQAYLDASAKKAETYAEGAGTGGL